MENHGPLHFPLPPRPGAAGNGHLPHPHAAAPAVVTCSICLRVLRESEWVAAEEAILELRSFDRREPLHLAPGLCDGCSHDLAVRRGQAAAQAA
jgi:hypothetical protein